MDLSADKLAQLEGEARFDFYWRTWKNNPQSVVFVPLAHIFLDHGLAAEAVAICDEGLVQHPELVSGRLVMARALIMTRALERARAVLQGIIALIPSHGEARRMLMDIQQNESVPVSLQPWRTVTMAKILANQGHYAEALQISEERLKSNPDDEALQTLAADMREKLNV